ncbi:MAG: TetR/AcrR family transcriptional regulator [Spirochaetes bacterium]|jgi:AcrR family transcriptional regulator|nr:TetR/AcrR family transcriptional regulator [Spirochaetota bacterium]
MALKRQKNPEDIKKEIIIKAREILSKMGYKKASTEEIARSLNKTKGALYHYFENREEIILSVIKYEGEQIKKSIEEAIEKEKDPRKKLQVYFEERLNKIHELFDFYKYVIEEYFKKYLFIMKALSDYNLEEYTTVQKILHEGVKTKVFQIPDVKMVSKTLIKAMKAYDFFMFLEENYEDTRNEMSAALKIFINGIAKK